MLDIDQVAYMRLALRRAKFFKFRIQFAIIYSLHETNSRCTDCYKDAITNGVIAVLTLRTSTSTMLTGPL